MEVPPAVQLMEAFTAVGASEAVNLERLELLGDSLLKFVATLYIFATSPPATDEGQLTYARVALISNSHLLRISLRHGLFRYLASVNFKHEYMYMPPYYAVADRVSLLFLSSLKFAALCLSPAGETIQIFLTTNRIMLMCIIYSK